MNRRRSIEGSGSTRERLLDATKQLVWQRGIEATSPGAILRASGAGQGSLYHHFSGKPALVAAATTSLAGDLKVETDALLDDENRPPLERIHAYLAKERDALRGCRLGRLAFDPALDVESGTPIVTYFTDLQRALRELLDRAVADGALVDDLDTGDLSATIVACVQGGYVLSAVTDTASAMDSALRGLGQLLDQAVRPRSPRPRRRS